MPYRIRELDSITCDLPPADPQFFASDLHADGPTKANDFTRPHRRAFLWFLEHEVEADGGNLTLVGDVWELWQCAWLDIPEWWRERLANYRLLRGNHDSARRRPKEYRWPHDVHLDGYDFPGTPVLLAEHGHEADVWNSSLGVVGWTVTAIAGILERLGWKDVDNWKWKHLRRPTTHPQYLPTQHYLDYAERRARETKTRLVILGHTHKPALAKRPWGIYGNCGCWVSHDYLGSFVRVGEGAVSLCEIV